jgi:anaerobic sulfite reductase subunit B
MNEYLPKKARILDFTRETPDTVGMRVGFSGGHAPGQFMMMSLPGIGEAPISISSCSNKYMDFHIKEVGNVTKALGRLDTDGWVFVRGPYGKGYPMKELKGQNIIMVGGGCGVAPLRSVVEYIETHRKDYGSVTLFFGYNSPETILFRKHIASWKRNFGLQLSVDRNPEKRMCYDARTGFITDTVKKAKIESENTAALLCGPPIMMKISIDALRGKWFKEDQIYISMERLMDCGLGICGHCMIHGKYTCLDGPVFRFDEISRFGDWL